MICFTSTLNKFFTFLQLDLIFNLLKQWKLIFNILVNRNGKKLTLSRKKKQNKQTNKQKNKNKNKILTVHRKS